MNDYRTTLDEIHARFSAYEPLIALLEIRIAELKERIIDADNRGEVAAQIRVLRDLKVEITPPPDDKRNARKPYSI